MRLYLNDIFKANDTLPDLDKQETKPAKTTPAKLGGGLPASEGTGPAVEYEYWPKDQGQPPVGGGWEQSPSGAWRRPKGSGGGKGAKTISEADRKTQVPTAGEGDQAYKVPQPAEAMNTLVDSKSTMGVYSTEPSDYPKDSHPLDHYKVAQYHEGQGYKEGAQSHKEIAKQRAKRLSTEEHAELAEQLRELGMQEAADYHSKHAEKRKEISDKRKEGKDVRRDEWELQHEDWTAEDHEAAAERQRQDKASKGDTYKKRYHQDQARKKRKAAEAKDGKKSKEKPSSKGEKEAIGDTPREPRTAVDRVLAEHHKQQVEELVSNLNQRLESGRVPDSEFKKLELAVEALNQQEVGKVPSKDQVKELQQLKKIAGKHGQAFQESSRRPSSEYDHAKVSDHSSQAKDLLSNLQRRIEEGGLDESEENRVKKLIAAVEEHRDLDGVPTKEQEKQLQQLKKMAGDYAKPSEEEVDPDETDPQEAQREEPKSKGPNLARMFQAGRAAGERIGYAAAVPYAAGAIGSMAITYATGGAVRAGHRLLTEEGIARDSQKKADAINQKTAEVEQSSMKSLPLYLDLYKAVNPPNVGSTTQTEERAKIKYESSYAKRPEGVASGEAHVEDDPNVGKKWRHDPDDSVHAEVERMLEEEAEEEKDGAEDTAAKSYSSEILKTLNSSIEQELKRILPNETETAFMVEVLGHDPDSVRKGLVTIKGKDRHRFNEWAHSRLQKSLGSLMKRLA